MNVARGTQTRRAAVVAIAANVLEAREAARVTRKTMAKALGITVSTLWRKETGGTEFKAPELVATAKVCDVDVGRRAPTRVSATRRTSGPTGAATATSSSAPRNSPN
jgi:transcriptional regulator with XRE-family HTH domain